MSLAVTVTRRYWLRSSLLTDAALIVLGSLLVAGMAQLRILVPFSPVPITGQTFAVLLIGAALGARRGASSLALYIVEGSLGLPFFAGGKAGLAVLLGPTGGYLIGFVAAAYLVGLLAERGFDRRFATAMPAFLAGQLVIYGFGVLGLLPFVGLQNALLAGVWPFVIGDVLKVALAGGALPAAWSFVRRFGK